MLEILIADDHPVIRSGVRNLLRNDLSMRVAAEAGSAADVIRQAAARKFDAILLDLSFTDGTGFDVLPILRSRHPDVPVIVFTNAAEMAGACLEAGAAAFVAKDASGEELKFAVESAIRGRKYVASSRQTHMNGDASSADVMPHLRLSKREAEIMQHLVDGKPAKNIAFELSISEKTVATHRARILKKLSVTDTRGLLLYALRAGLTDWSA